MVQILPEVPGFGKQFAQNLGKGFSTGLDFTAQMMQERHKQNQRKKLIEGIEGGQSSPQFKEQLGGEQSEQQFLEALPQIEQHLGRELTPKDIDQLWSQAQQLQEHKQGQTRPEDSFEKAKKSALADEGELARIYTAKGKEESKQRFQEKKEMEPKIEALQSKVNNLESEAMDFGRLNELFAPENDDDYPPSWAVGLFMKNGELNENILGNLSTNAQEAVKLIANRVTGLKDTFGSQITGFEVRKFMERLPSLLNSAEGRRRVLRDLDIGNEINQLHAQGVLDIIDRYGGAGEISMSKAESIFKKENAKQLKELRQEYINPESGSFSELTPGTARRNRDREVIDPETGQKFRSDGSNWIPVVD